MDELPQRFIIDFLIERGLPVPNLFYSPEIAERMNDKGFKLPYQPDYVSTVDAVNKRYPNRYVVPFGHRVGDDDIVAFIYSPKGLGAVILFHGWTSPGYENPTYYSSLSDWIEGKDYYDSKW
jgi:hypothetical protein